MEWAETEPRGEIVLVIAGAEERQFTAAEVVEQVHELVAAGSRLKAAVAQVAQASGVSSSELYQLALDTRLK